MLTVANDLCTELTCPAHGELNRLRVEVRELREALDAERDSLHRHADVIATQRNEAYTRAERAETSLAEVKVWLAQANALNPTDFQTDKHLAPAFRSTDFRAAFKALVEVVNGIEAAVLRGGEGK